MASVAGCKEGAPTPALATVRLVQVQWTGVTIKTLLLKEILHSMGFRVTEKTLPVYLVLKSLAQGTSDIFLGGWLSTLRPLPLPLSQEQRAPALRPEYGWS